MFTTTSQMPVSIANRIKGQVKIRITDACAEIWFTFPNSLNAIKFYFSPLDVDISLCKRWIWIYRYFLEAWSFLSSLLYLFSSFFLLRSSVYALSANLVIWFWRIFYLLQTDFVLLKYLNYHAKCTASNVAIFFLRI